MWIMIVSSCFTHLLHRCNKWVKHDDTIILSSNDQTLGVWWVSRPVWPTYRRIAWHTAHSLLQWHCRWQSLHVCRLDIYIVTVSAPTDLRTHHPKWQQHFQIHWLTVPMERDQCGTVMFWGSCSLELGEVAWPTCQWSMDCTSYYGPLVDCESHANVLHITTYKSIS